jgi:hypothetical protein
MKNLVLRAEVDGISRGHRPGVSDASAKSGGLLSRPSSSPHDHSDSPICRPDYLSGESSRECELHRHHQHIDDRRRLALCPKQHGTDCWPVRLYCGPVWSPNKPAYCSDLRSSIGSVHGDPFRRNDDRGSHIQHHERPSHPLRVIKFDIQNER